MPRRAGALQTVLFVLVQTLCASAVCNPKDSPADCAFIDDAVATWGVNSPPEWRDDEKRTYGTICTLAESIICANNYNISSMCAVPTVRALDSGIEHALAVKQRRRSIACDRG